MNWSPSLVLVHSSSKTRSPTEFGFLGRCLARPRRSDRLIVSGSPSSARTSIGASEVISVRSCVRVPRELPARSLMVVCSLVAETAVSCGSCVWGVELVTVFISRSVVMAALHENATRLEHSHLTAVFRAYFLVYINYIYPSCMILSPPFWLLMTSIIVVVIVVVLVMFRSGNVAAR